MITILLVCGEACHNVAIREFDQRVPIWPQEPRAKRAQSICYGIEMFIRQPLPDNFAFGGNFLQGSTIHSSITLSTWKCLCTFVAMLLGIFTYFCSNVLPLFKTYPVVRLQNMVRYNSTLCFHPNPSLLTGRRLKGTSITLILAIEAKKNITSRQKYSLHPYPSR